MGMFDDRAIAHRFSKARTPQENLDGFRQIWGNFTNSYHTNPGIFKYLALFAVRVDSGDGADSDVRLAALLDHRDMGPGYLVIDGVFLGTADVQQIAELLKSTDEFLAGRAPDIMPTVFYCKVPAPRTEHMQDLEAARELCGHLAGSSFARLNSEEFLQMFKRA
jgi:hypothetical protein